MTTSRQHTAPDENGHYKDAILARLASHRNVAQFVSFGPGTSPEVRHACLHGERSAKGFRSVEDAIRTLLQRAAERSVNIRAFDPAQPKSHEFLYGLANSDTAATEIRRLAGQGLFTIANETIDIHDGGVSGVSYAGILEFAPEDTPRCVEKPGTIALPYPIAARLLETVYGFRLDLDESNTIRTEFSIHPLKRGVRQAHTIIWEEERTEHLQLAATPVWPNRFSRFIGDKAFGLLIADAYGLRVPETTVVSRRIAPFRFGTPTGGGERWFRTCPTEQIPGRFTTQRGWLDPFTLLHTEDPDGTQIASVLAQDGVEPSFSGAAATDSDRNVIVEGVAGNGERFMQGNAAPESLPADVIDDVRSAADQAMRQLGPVRAEWVHDGNQAWIVQLHVGATPSRDQIIYPGDPTVVHPFPVEHGLEALRALTQQLQDSGEGIALVGAVGITSHLGDVLRRARIPSYIQPQ